MNNIWRPMVERRLAKPDAPRVMSPETLAEWLDAQGLAAPARTLARALQAWCEKGLLSSPVRGVYLNRQVHPLVLPEEIAQLLRPGAILSMSTVLGRAGILNNPTYWISATLPTDATKGPVDITLDDGRMLRFAYMRPDFIAGPGHPMAGDALDPDASAPSATPEKALLDWLYLSSSARGGSRWPLPALHDLDLDDLDAGRLDRLAGWMQMQGPLAQLRHAWDNDRPRVKVGRPRRPR